MRLKEDDPATQSAQLSTQLCVRRLCKLRSVSGPRVVLYFYWSALCVYFSSVYTSAAPFMLDHIRVISVRNRIEDRGR